MIDLLFYATIFALVYGGMWYGLKWLSSLFDPMRGAK